MGGFIIFIQCHQENASYPLPFQHITARDRAWLNPKKTSIQERFVRIMLKTHKNEWSGSMISVNVKSLDVN